MVGTKSQIGRTSKSGYTTRASGGRSVIKSGKWGKTGFRVYVDDTELRDALDFVKREGDETIREYMRQALRVGAAKAREFLLEQKVDNDKTAAQVKGVRVGSSKNVYVKLAENLRVSSVGDRTSIISRPYPTGLIGSRGGKLAHIHAGGTGPFPYSENTPYFVKSSIAWYLKTRSIQGPFVAPLRQMHPGFRKVDYIGVAEAEFDRMVMDKKEGLLAYVQKRLLSKRFYTQFPGFPGQVSLPPWRDGEYQLGGGLDGTAETFYSGQF